MSDSEESVFNFDIDEGDTSLPRPEKTSKYERACAWTFQDRRHCSQLPLVLQEFIIEIEDRRENTFQEFKRRSIMHHG